MQIQFEITPNNAIAMARYWFQYSPVSKLYCQVLTITASLSFLTLGVMNIFVRSDLKYSWLITIILLALGVIGYFMTPIWYRHLFDRRMERAFKNFLATKRGRMKLGEHTLSISEQGIINTTTAKQSYLPWSRIDHIEQNDVYIVIFFNSILGVEIAHLIPKCAFTNEAQMKEFYDTTQRFLVRG